MNTLTTPPPPQAKLLGRPRAKLMLAIGAAAVLALGSATAPRTATTPLTPPVERSAPLLEAALERRQATEVLERARELGTRVVGYSVRFPAPARPPQRTQGDLPGAPAPPLTGLGVVVSGDGRVLSHADALAGRREVAFQLPGGAAVDAVVIAYEPSTGLVLLAPRTSLELSAPAFSTRPLVAGTMTTAAGRGPGADVLGPVAVTSSTADRYRLGGSESLPVGTPLWDADGALLAIAGPDATAYPAGDAVARLTTLATDGQGQPSVSGVTFQPLAPALTPWFGDTGALVADVLRGGPAERAGLEPGDVVRQVGDAAVADLPEALARLRELAPGATTTLQLVRDRRPLTLTLTPAFAVSLHGRTGSETRPDSRSAVRLRNVVPEHGGEDLPLSPDARVLAVNGRDATSVDQLGREIGRGRSGSLLYVEDRGERFFLAVPGRAR